MPFGGDGCRVEVVDVSWFHPAVLAEGVVDAVFVVAVPGGVGSYVRAEFEWVVSVLLNELLMNVYIKLV